MAKKTHKSEENTVSSVLQEPAVAYRRMKSPGVVDWNPNVPVHATQEEWWEHFHRIEKGHFTPWEEAEKEFEIWREKYLANRLK